MSHIKRANAFVHKVESWTNAIGISFVMVMMTLTVVDVLLRTLFSSPIQGAYEISEMLMVVIVFLGMSYTKAAKGHIRMDVLGDRLSPRAVAATDLLADVIFLFLFILILWQGLGLASEALRIHEKTGTIVRFPVFPARLTVVIGASLVCVRSLVDLAGDAMRLVRGGQTTNE